MHESRYIGQNVGPTYQDFFLENFFSKKCTRAIKSGQTHENDNGSDFRQFFFSPVKKVRHASRCKTPIHMTGSVKSQNVFWSARLRTSGQRFGSKHKMSTASQPFGSKLVHQMGSIYGAIHTGVRTRFDRSFGERTRFPKVVWVPDLRTSS